MTLDQFCQKINNDPKLQPILREATSIAYTYGEIEVGCKYNPELFKTINQIFPKIEIIEDTYDSMILKTQDTRLNTNITINIELFYRGINE